MSIDGDYERWVENERIKQRNEEHEPDWVAIDKSIREWETKVAKETRIAHSKWEQEKKEQEERESNCKRINRNRETYDKRIVYDKETGNYYTIRNLEKEYPRLRTVAKALGWIDGNTLLDKEDFERKYNDYIHKFDAFCDWTKDVEFEKVSYLSYIDRIAQLKGQEVSSHVVYLMELLDERIKDDVNEIIKEINLEMNIPIIQDILNRVRNGEVFVRLGFPRLIIDLEPDFDGDYHYDGYVGDLYTILAKIFKSKTINHEYLEYYGTAPTKENIILDNYGNYRMLVDWFDLQRKGISGD